MSLVCLCLVSGCSWVWWLYFASLVVCCLFGLVVVIVLAIVLGFGCFVVLSGLIVLFSAGRFWRV